jgi:hypothetical protein
MLNAQDSDGRQRSGDLQSSGPGNVLEAQFRVMRSRTQENEARPARQFPKRLLADWLAGGRFHGLTELAEWTDSLRAIEGRENQAPAGDLHFGRFCLWLTHGAHLRTESFVSGLG